jgi:hypothetical protein
MRSFAALRAGSEHSEGMITGKQLPVSGVTPKHCPQAHGAGVAAIGESFGPGNVALPQLPSIQPQQVAYVEAADIGKGAPGGIGFLSRCVVRSAMCSAI